MADSKKYIVLYYDQDGLWHVDQADHKIHQTKEEVRDSVQKFVYNCSVHSNSILVVEDSGAEISTTVSFPPTEEEDK